MLTIPGEIDGSLPPWAAHPAGSSDRTTCDPIPETVSPYRLSERLRAQGLEHRFADVGRAVADPYSRGAQGRHLFLCRALSA